MSTLKHLDKTGLRLGRMLSATAHRLGEIVAYSSEISYLARENVTYRVNNDLHTDPPMEILSAMKHERERCRLSLPIHALPNLTNLAKLIVPSRPCSSLTAHHVRRQAPLETSNSREHTEDPRGAIPHCSPMKMANHTHTTSSTTGCARCSQLSSAHNSQPRFRGIHLASSSPACSEQRVAHTT